MIQCILYMYILTLTKAILSLHKDNTATRFGIVIHKTSLEAWFVCYEKVKPSENSKNQLENIKIEHALCINNSIPYNCLKSAIAQCKINVAKTQELKVNVVYSIDLKYEYTKDKLDSIWKKDSKSVSQFSKAKNYVYTQIQADEKVGAAIEFLKFRYNSQTSSFNTVPLVYFSSLGIIIGMLTNTPKQYDSWMVKRIFIGNTLYDLVVYDFYCLSLHRIKHAINHLLYQMAEKDVSTDHANKKMNHPCFVDGYRENFSSKMLNSACYTQPSHKYRIDFVGKFNLEICLALIDTVFHQDKICNTETNCNFSKLDKKLFYNNINEIEIVNSYIETDKLKTYDLKMVLLELTKEACKMQKAGTQSEKIDFFQKCFQLTLLYAFLCDRSIETEHVLVSISRVTPKVFYSKLEYLFFDREYGSFFPENAKTITPLPQTPTSDKSLDNRKNQTPLKEQGCATIHSKQETHRELVKPNSIYHKLAAISLVSFISVVMIPTTLWLAYRYFKKICSNVSQ